MPTFLSTIISYIVRFLFKETVNGNRIPLGGLLPHVEDERDFLYSMLGVSVAYQPKHIVWEIPTVSVKDQQTLNTCAWNSATAQAEIDEKVQLSVRGLVCNGRKTNSLSGNGFTTLRATQECAKSFGFIEEKLLPNVITDWETYSNYNQITPAMVQNASTHKSKSSFIVSSKNDVLKALDDGRVVQTGFTWYSKYNMGGGLTAPWILPWRQGFEIGGHSVLIVGYDISKQLLKFQNSFGPDWGDKGCFYVRFQDFFPEFNVGYVRVDMDKTAQEALMASYEGKCIKCEQSPSIFLVKQGKKCHFPDEITFYGYGDHFNPNGTYSLIAQSVINLFPDGETVTIQDSPYWSILSSKWDQIKAMPVADALSTIQFLLKNK